MFVRQATSGRECVARLMRRGGYRAGPKRRGKPIDPGNRSLHQIAFNVLDRQFVAPGPNQKWAADFTDLWTLEGWLYVAVVLGLFARRVVGWSMHATMTSQLTAMPCSWRSAGGDPSRRSSSTPTMAASTRAMTSSACSRPGDPVQQESPRDRLG